MSTQPHQMGMPYSDRREAGRALGSALDFMAGRNPVVLALARGGVPVGYELARSIGAELQVALVRKVGAPGNPEYGIGAVSEGGVRVLDQRSVALLGITNEEVAPLVQLADDELASQVLRFRAGEQAPSLAGRAVIVVDDGLATGWTATAAVRSAKARGAAWVMVAVPVGSHEVVQRLQKEADEVICLLVPSPLGGVGAWYDDFSQVPDSEVLELLGSEDGTALDLAMPPVKERPVAGEVPVLIPIDGGPVLEGDLRIPADASGLVIFAHGSGSSRLSTRNRHVAEVMGRQGLATLLFDLLSSDEETDRSNVFDIPLLARRLSAATDWAAGNSLVADLPVGYFGASTGAGAALVAAAGRNDVAAVVSRGGRPDLAGAYLGKVTAPVLLIVGENDREVWAMNQRASEDLAGPARLVVVPGATHLFEEPGTLDIAAALAAEWFSDYLARQRRA